MKPKIWITNTIPLQAEQSNEHKKITPHLIYQANCTK